jgi:hypothetical protein
VVHMRVSVFGYLAIVFVGMFVSLPPAYPKEAAAILSERELGQLFPGKFVAYAYGVARINLTANADGTVYGKMGRADTGVWRLHGKELCIKFTRWLKGRNRCSPVSKQGEWYKTGPITFKKIGPGL